jgi:hypothetical protein
LDFWNNLSFLQWASAISALTLTLGAIAEYKDKLNALAKLFLKLVLLRSNAFERCTLCKLFGHSIGPLLVVLGIAGELIFGTRSFIVDNRLMAESEDKRIRLEAVIQPRLLDKQQKQAIETSMRPFSKDNVLIASQWIDLEAARLAKEIKASLNRAGIGRGDIFSTMTVDKIGAYPEIITGLFNGGGGTEGPQLRSGIEIWGTDRSAVMTLAADLVNMPGVTTPPQSENPYAEGILRDYASMSLVVFVGIKPIPDVK